MCDEMNEHDDGGYAGLIGDVNRIVTLNKFLVLFVSHQSESFQRAIVHAKVVVQNNRLLFK
jgi:hypothetical protein